jgi:hypothetical protein
MIGQKLSWLRRRGNAVSAVLGLIASLTTLGVEMDTGKMYVARHKDQVMSDAATMAAMLKLPYKDQAIAAGDLVLSTYKKSYNPNFTATYTFYPAGSTVPTSVRVDIGEKVPMIFPALMGIKERPTAALAAAARLIPSALLSGVVPLGFQDQDFDIPAAGTASPNVVTLKLGTGDKKITPGNCYALDFPDSSGAKDWGAWMKFGYDQKISVGDVIKTKPGVMDGPTTKAVGLQSLGGDLDSRLERASVYPYSEDSWDKRISPGNPRVLIVPLVDWKSASGGESNLTIKGFAAFWLDSYDTKNGKLSGRFVRKTVGASAWEGISIDPRGDSSYDRGLWMATMTT